MQFEIKPVHFALLTIPFLVLYFVDFLPFVGHSIENSDNQLFRLMGDLVFLNNVHAAFSFFLYYKVANFRQAIGPSVVVVALALIAATLSSLLMLGMNTQVILWLAMIHAIMQSGGVFLLYFCPQEQRKFAKWVVWILLIVVLQQKAFPNSLSGDARLLFGLAGFLLLGWLSKSYWGLLFSVRFAFWFSGTNIGDFSVAALHGLEYLLICLVILKKSPDFNFRMKDGLILTSLMVIPAYYTLNAFYEIYFLPLTFLFFMMVYSHYLFDTYSFRFRFQKPRQFVLPLFKTKEF